MSRRIAVRLRGPALAIAAALLVTGAIAAGAYKAMPLAADPVETALRSGWPASAPDAAPWPRQDATQRACTQFADRPPDVEAVAIMEREWRTIVYPADGLVFGEWRRGAELARTTVAPNDAARPAMAGQCLTCHRLEPMDPVEARPGPELAGYGHRRGNGPDQQRLLYEQIFNSNAVNACSAMPRFGVHKVLSPNEIRDIVAYLLSPQSPVNARAGLAHH